MTKSKARSSGALCGSLISVLAAGLLVLALGSGVVAASDHTEDVAVLQGAQVVGGPVTPIVVDVDLRDLPRAPAWRPGDPIKEIPRRFYPPKNEGSRTHLTGAPDPLARLQLQFEQSPTRAFTTPVVNFAGDEYTGVSPPDTVGDVSLTHYIQSINDSGGSIFSVYDKDGTLQAGPIFMDSLGSGSCASGAGDPIVLYDRLADRWFLQEFSSSGNNLCIYISQTADPVTGGWYHYAFATPEFPDYPHFGVWPDAYYGTANESTAPSVFAMDRVNMIAGTTARPMQRFTATKLSGYGFQTLTPADLDGATPPPANAPGILMRHYDDEAHDSASADPNTDLLKMFAFTVDWDTPANSSFSELAPITITDFNSWLVNYSIFYSVPQPGTSSRLDPIREVILHRLQYRNYGDHESLVGSLPTNINAATTGSDVNVGVRWFELRRSGGGAWSLYQEGTFGMDQDATENRFVPSVAMDQSGNVALAYSITDTDAATPVYPSLRYTGRHFDDPLSVMTEGETQVVTGTSAGSGRWGDYSSMNVDPEDDCTFWFTSEFQDGSWKTQIAAFRFETCGCAIVITPPSASAVVAGNNQIDVSWDDSATPEITEYRLYRSMDLGGPYDVVTTLTDTSPGSGGGAGYVYHDTDVSGGTTYHYVVRSSDGGACLSPPSTEASATATGDCTLAPSFGGIDSATNSSLSTCTIGLAWTAGTSHCSGALTYEVFRSTTPGFVPAPENRIASGVSGSTYDDSDGLEFPIEYHYIVRARDAVNGAIDDNLAEELAIPTGPGGGSPTNYAYAGAPISIPDNNSTGITSTINVADSSPIADILVNVDITHTYRGDLIVKLISPTGTEVTLHSRSGSSADNLITTYDTLTVPDGPGDMADFDGEIMAGTWQLVVSDNANLDTGDLNAWSLDITPLVSCQTSLAEDIFADDFESGNMSLWSRSVP